MLGGENREVRSIQSEYMMRNADITSIWDNIRIAMNVKYNCGRRAKIKKGGDVNEWEWRGDY